MQDRLLGGVVMCLMDLTIDCGDYLLVLGASDVLILHGGCHCLVHCGVMMTTLAANDSIRIISFTSRFVCDLHNLLH